MNSSDLTLKKDHPEEVACCRVCHGESEPDNPLFYPCKCDGSIRYVHQECLVQWLKVSKQKQPKCELCGEKFHFQNVYKDGAPVRLGVFELFLELLPRILLVSRTIVYVLFSVFFWCVCLPLFTNWWVKVCWCVVSDLDSRSCSLSVLPLIDSIEHITLAWYNGVVNICVIVAISVLCFELGQIVYREYDIAEKNRNIRMLERQLIDNLDRLRRYEEERRQSEVRMMCLSDYQSLKNEWDAKKQESELEFHALQAANPFMTDREMNQHLISNLRIDVYYTSRMLLRLEEISAVPQMEYFGTLKDCYTRVNSVLVKHIGDGKEVKAGEQVRDDLERQARENHMIQSLVADPFLHDVVMKELNETDALTNVEGKMRFGPTSDSEKLDLLRTVLSEKSAPSTPKNSEMPNGGASNSSSSSSSGLVGAAGGPSSGVEAGQVAGSESVDEFGRVIYDHTDYEARGREMMKRFYEAEQNKKKEQGAVSANTSAEEVNLSGSSSSSSEHPEREFNSKLSGDETPPATDDHQGGDLDPAPLNQTIAGSSSSAAIAPSPPRAIEFNGRLFTPMQLREDNNNVENLGGIDRNLPPIFGPEPVPVPPVVQPANAADGAVDQIVLPALADDNAVIGGAQALLAPRGDDFFGLRHLMICFFYIMVFVILVLVLPALIGRILVDSSVLPLPVREKARSVIMEMLEQENIHNILSTKLFVDYDALVAKAEAVASAAALSSTTAVYGAGTAAGADSTVETIKPIIADMFYEKFKVLFEIMLGYGVYSSACLLLYVVYCINYARTMHMYRFSSVVDFFRAQAANMQNAAVLLSKTSLLLTVYGGILPMGIAVLVSKALAKSVGVNISIDVIRKQVEDASVGASAGPSDSTVTAVETTTRIFSEGLINVYAIDPIQVVFGIFLYLFAFLFMSHVLCIAIELRGLIHKDLLVNFLPIKSILDFPPVVERAHQMGADLNRLNELDQVMNHLVNNPQNVIIEHVNQDGQPLGGLPRGGGGVRVPAAGAAIRPLGNPRRQLNRHVNDNVGGAAAGAVGVDIEIRLGGNRGVNPLPNNHIDGIQHTIAKITFSRIWKKFLINAAILVPSILMSIIVPVKFGHILCPFSEPLLLRFKSTAGEVQIPIEMILSHIFLPLLLEKMKYRKNIRRLMTGFLTVLAPPLGLEWILAPEAFPRLAPAPPVAPAAAGPNVAVNAPNPPAPAAVEPVVAPPPADADADAPGHIDPEPVEGEGELPPPLEVVPSLDAPATSVNEENGPIDSIARVSSEDSSDDCPGVELSEVLSVTRSRSHTGDSSSSNAEQEWSELRSVSSAASCEVDENGAETGGDVLADISELLESPTEPQPCVSVQENPAIESIADKELHSPIDEVQVPAVHEPTGVPPAVPPAVPEPHAAEEVNGGAASRPEPSPLSRLPLEMRIALLLVAGMLLMGVVSSWAIHFPLAVGRRSVSLVGIPPSNDIFNYPMGLIVCWGGSYVLDFILRDLMNNFNLTSLVKVMAKWSAVVGKVVVLGVVWLVVPPMAIGLLIESLFIIPLRTPFNETPQYPFLQCWAIGLILFKVWARCVLTGMFGDIALRLQFEQILIRGFAQFDAWSALVNVIVPVTRRLFDLLLIPFFAARTASVFIQSYYVRTLLVRFSIHIYIGLRILFHLIRHVYHYLVTLHNEVRDSRYLIGTKLTNREKQA